jgi:hypothetical protein
MDDDQTRRLAENEAIFRELNEAIQRAAATHGGGGHLYEFICECSDVACAAILRMTAEEYEHVRASGVRFAVMAGHEDQRVERVVEQHERFRVVEKLGPGASTVRQLDPRRRP